VGDGVSLSSDWTWTGDQNTVKSYIYANKLFTRPLVSDIKGLPTTVEWSYNTTDIRANVAYDIFTDPDPEHPNYSGEYELMIW
jgi:xyloglucan-specific endo-beta-1,4-glucanase